MKRSHVPSRIRRFIIQYAAKRPEIERVILFGSRARGDARDRSDFDIAIVAPDMPRDAWAEFALEFQERIPTLCKVDLVLIDPSRPSHLQKQIATQGIPLYARAA